MNQKTQGIATATAIAYSSSAQAPRKGDCEAQQEKSFTYRDPRLGSQLAISRLVLNASHARHRQDHQTLVGDEASGDLVNLREQIGGDQAGESAILALVAEASDLVEVTLGDEHTLYVEGAHGPSLRRT